MWRPKNWDIMNYCSVEEQMEDPLLAMHFFEAGADAMLEALDSVEDRIVHDNSGKTTFNVVVKQVGSRKGRWVFIPEENDD